MKERKKDPVRDHNIIIRLPYQCRNHVKGTTKAHAWIVVTYTPTVSAKLVYQFNWVRKKERRKYIPVNEKKKDIKNGNERKTDIENG